MIIQYRGGLHHSKRLILFKGFLSSTECTIDNCGVTIDFQKVLESEMTEQQQQDKVTGFRTIILLKDQTLGFGSYGSVCKAKCDDLLCAAKIIHPTLLDPTELHQIAPHREHRQPIKRFQLECSEEKSTVP